MMNKKGEDETGSSIIVISLAILVFVIVGGLFAYFMLSGPGSWFKAILPDFNNNATVTGVEKVRYDILNDKVQYFNEKNRWTDFSGQIILDGKTLNYNDLRNTFINDYMNAQRSPKIIQMDASGSHADIKNNPVLGGTITKDPWWYLGPKSISPDGGDIRIDLFIAHSDKANDGYYFYKLNGNLVYYSLDATILKYDIITNNEDKLKGEAKAWRDAPLKTYWVVNYQLLNGDKLTSKSLRVCAELNSAQYLTFDLTQEVFTTDCS